MTEKIETLIALAHEFRQLGDHGRNPPRLVFGEQLGSRSPPGKTASVAAAFGTRIAYSLAMTDENYSLVLLQIVCLLIFACGFAVLTHHPEWFGA